MARRRTAESVVVLCGIWVAAAALPGLARAAPPATRPAVPDEFVDPETHLRVVHLSRVPNDRSGVIYFTYPCVTQDSRLAVFDVQFPDKWRHLYTFDLQTQAVRPLVTDRLTQDQVLAPRSGHLYYMADNAAWVINVRGGEPRKIADLPPKWCPGAGFSVNADETQLLGASADVDGTKGPAASLAQTFAQHLPNVLFTVDLRSGQVRAIHRVDTWLGHVQFSPTDPALLMFCHEGPWEQLDRIWTMRVGDAAPSLLYARTEPREIVGHEFWAPDGKSIWFQQTFRAERKSFLTGKDLASGKLTQYTVPEGGRSIHFTFGPDGRYFIGDGDGKGPTGPDKYLSMLTREGDHLRLTKLCSLQANDYAIEPNPHVSPDGRWVVFTATLFGTPQAYAVEVPAAMTAATRP
jgi:oligogalacturonide lyase